MGKFYKIIISFIVATILIMSIEINAYAAAFTAPYLPYVPPADVEILGWINNLYGVGAISEGTETEKLEAYWNMYRAILGSAFDNFKAEMQEVLDNAKTSRKIVIKPTLNQTINEVLKNAINNGVQIGEAIPASTTPQEWVDRLADKGITMTLQQAQYLQSRIGNNYYGATARPYTLAVAVMVSGTIVFAPYYVGKNMSFVPYPYYNRYTQLYDGVNYNQDYYSYMYSINLSTMTVGSDSGDGYGSVTFEKYQNYAFLLGAEETRTSVASMSTAAVSAINAEDQIPITANTEMDGQNVDNTKNIIINLPAINPYPGITAEQIAEVLRKLGVVPISETQDVSETVTDLQEESATKYGDTGDYSLNLTNLFPFCIPFDIGYAISLFAADPQAPSFDWVFPVGYEDGELIYETFNVNLSAFDGVALVLRKGLDILLIVGLGLITRDKFLRG